MIRRAVAATFMLLLGVSACKEDAAPVQPDRIVTTASSIAAPGAAHTQAANAGASATPTSGALVAAPPTDGRDGVGAAPSATVSAEAVAGAESAPDVPAVAADQPPPEESDAEPVALPRAAAPVATLAHAEPLAAKTLAGAGPGSTAKAKGSAQAPAAKAPAAAPAKPSAAGVTSELKLVKAGAAPFKKLRLRVNKGQVETMKMVLTMDMSVKELGQKQALPPMAMTMRLKVAETRANGDIKYDFTLTKTDVIGGAGHDPRMVAGMKQAMQKIYGLSGYAVVSDRGMNREAKINLPPTVDAQTKQVMQGMEQAMQQIGAPLPVEEVGKGARWTYTTRMSQAGVKLTQVATYDLLSIEGNKLVLRARVKQTAPKQQVAAPTGMKVALLKLDSKGKGKTRMMLNLLAPSKSTMKLKSTMTMAAGEDKTMTITTGMLIDISSS